MVGGPNPSERAIKIKALAVNSDAECAKKLPGHTMGTIDMGTIDVTVKGRVKSADRVPP